MFPEVNEIGSDFNTRYKSPKSMTEQSKPVQGPKITFLSIIGIFFSNLSSNCGGNLPAGKKFIKSSVDKVSNIIGTDVGCP